MVPLACTSDNQQCIYFVPDMQTIISQTLGKEGDHNNSQHKFLGVLGKDTSLPGLGEGVSLESSPSSAKP